MTQSTKRAIARAAALEFLEQGFSAASLSSIAQRLGLTKGALVYHFPEKAAFATHFIELVNDANRLAEEFACAEYPHSGSRKLLLQFLQVRTWREMHPEFAAGVALTIDGGSPTSSAADVLRSWLRSATEAFQQCAEAGQLDPAVTPLEAAEMFVVTNLGATFFGDFVRLNAPGTQQLRFVRLALLSLGFADAHEQADEVIERYGHQIAGLPHLAER